MLLLLWLFGEHAQSLYLYILNNRVAEIIEEVELGPLAISIFIPSVAVGINFTGHQCSLPLSGIRSVLFAVMPQNNGSGFYLQYR